MAKNSKLVQQVKMALKISNNQDPTRPTRRARARAQAQAQSQAKKNAFTKKLVRNTERALKTPKGFSVRKPPKVKITKAPQTKQTFDEFMNSHQSIPKDDRIKFNTLNITVNANEFFFLLAEDVKHDNKSLKDLDNNNVLRLIYEQYYKDTNWINDNNWMKTTKQRTRIKGLVKTPEGQVKNTFLNLFKQPKSIKKKLETNDIINFNANIGAPLLTVYDAASKGGASTIMVGKQYLNYLLTPPNWMDGGFFLTPTSRGGDAVMYTNLPLKFTISADTGGIIFDGEIKPNTTTTKGWGVKLNTLFRKQVNTTIEVAGKGEADTYLSKFFGDFAQILYCLAFQDNKRKNNNESKVYLFWQTSDKIAQTIYLFMAQQAKKAPALIAEIGNDPKSGIPKSVDMYLPKNSLRSKMFIKALGKYRESKKYAPAPSFGNSRRNGGGGNGNTNNNAASAPPRRSGAHGNRSAVASAAASQAHVGIKRGRVEGNGESNLNKQLGNLLNAKYGRYATLNQVQRNMNQFLRMKYNNKGQPPAKRRKGP